MIFRKASFYVEETSINWPELNRLFNYLAGIAIIILILGILTYGEPFYFSDEPYSALGRFWSPTGNLNIKSMIIFAAGLILSALTCFRIERTLNGRYNHWLFTICGTGYLLMLAPCDILNPIHSLGVLMVIGSLWFFSVFSLFTLLHSIGILRFLLYQLLLHGTLLPYAFNYTFDLPALQAVQKFAIIGLIVAMKLIVIELRKAASQDEITI